MRKALSALSILIVLSMLFACGGGGGGGGRGNGSGGDSTKTVKLGFNVISNDGRVVNRSISATGTNPLLDAKYYYKATPKWRSKNGANIAGATTGFVQFDPVTFSDNYTIGQWEFEIEIRTNTANKVILYKTDSAASLYINEDTAVIPVTVTKQFNGTGIVAVDIYAKTLSNDEEVIFYYDKVGGSERSVKLVGEKITSDSYAGFTEFKYINPDTGDRLSLEAGMYIFRFVHKYTYVDDENVSHLIEDESVATCEVFGDGEVVVKGTLEENSQYIDVSFALNGIYAIGLTVKTVVSTTDDTEITSVAINAGESRVFKAVPATGQDSGKNWITYIEPDTYQWYVNGEAVTTGVSGEKGEYYTFSTNASTPPNTSYVYCIVSKKNGDVIEYAAGAGKVLVVRPPSN